MRVFTRIKKILWCYCCRQMAAGDHLRILYEQLSKDPNSLANLDQDLPNYAQHQVPIFSLPKAGRQSCHSLLACRYRILHSRT